MGSAGGCGGVEEENKFGMQIVGGKGGEIKLGWNGRM